MKKMQKAASPDAYVEALSGWQRDVVITIRAAARTSPDLDEIIKWGNIVYMANGPVLVIRGEEERVILGFWRGQRLREIEPRLKPGGKYEMANVEFRGGMTVDADVVRKLVKEAVNLDARLGDPTRL